MKTKLIAIGQLGAVAALSISLCMAADRIEPEYLQVADVANEVFLKRPMVRASGNVVNIDDKSVPNEYFGNLYIGSESWRATVSFDTMSDWTVVDNDFDVMSSDSSKLWELPDGEVVKRTVDLGPGMKLEGPVYNESMCLIHTGEPGDSGSARLCVKDLPFVLASIDNDENSYQGVLGLARGKDNGASYVKALQRQGVIQDAVVSFNYENPDDWSQMSQVAFGEILYSEIDGGEDGTNFYSNLGRNQWGLLIDDFLYNDQDMTNGQRAKIALIDSGNVSIQLPQFVWENVLVSMQHEALGADYRIIKEKTDKGLWEIRIPNKNCDEVVDKLKPIEFKLENTTIIIKPKGYTYQYYKNQGYCQIGMTSLPGESSEYRLGTIFLRNFYTAFDFDNDLIIIGLNRGTDHALKAGIDGHRANPFKKSAKGNSAGIFILMLFLTLVAVAVVYFVLQRREKIKKKKQSEIPPTAEQ